MKYSNKIKRLFLMVVAAITALQYVQGPVYALSEELLNKYSANNIMFYNPEECDDGSGNGSGSSTTLSGNDTPEKMWNYLIGKGFKDAQVAGILGNSYVESWKFNPAAARNSTYWGLFQFLLSYNPGLVEEIDAAGLSRYMDYSIYGGDGGDASIPDADKDKLIQIQMDYMMSQNAENWQSIIKQKEGDAHEVEYATEVFLVHLERAIGGSDKLEYYDDPIYHGSKNYQDASGRREHAREMYEKYSGGGGGTSKMTDDECCDPKNGANGSDELWNGTKYSLSDKQVKGIAAMANNENGGSVEAIKSEVSLMANLFEKNHASDAGNGDELIKYIKTGGWFASSTGAAYDENYSNDAYTNATKDILVNGNRTLPPQVVEHDCFYEGACTAGIGSAYNNGEEIDIHDKSKFERGVTVLKQQGFSSNAKYIFWDWADPKAKTGDPFGYYESDPPQGNSNKGSNSEECCDRDGKVVTATIDGNKYAFPLVGATHSNYLQPNNRDGAGDSVLSGLPCPGFNCHHDYRALDMGVRMEMISGDKAKEYGYDGSSNKKMYYYSAGASVAAFTDGTIAYASEYKNSVPESWWDKCGQIALDGTDGNHYWLGHLDYSSIKVKQGETVKAGDIIAKVGAPECAQSTQSHLHIDNHNGKNAKSDTWTIEVINKLWEKLDGSDSGSGVTTCDTGDLPAGGMTLEEAKKFMEIYANLPNPQSDDPWKIKANDFPDSCGTLTNCVEFSLYFIHRYTSARFPDGLPDGGKVVSTLIDSGQGFKDGGGTPKLYAIFSTKTHTGVVCGIDEDNDKIVICEAGCPHWPAQANEYPLSEWTGNGHTYAYTDGILGGGMNAK